jgi:hypothetical protein
LAGCASRSSSSVPDVQAKPVVDNSSSNTPPTTVDDSPIRRIDFKNFTFDWYPPDYDVPPSGKKIVLKDGEMHTNFSYGKEPREFYLIGAIYGDLTKDGQEEAVVVVGVINSGTARSGMVFVYIIIEDMPKRIGVYETGDRWDYGYNDADVVDGQLMIERYKPVIIEDKEGQFDMSQSKVYIRDYYNWNENRFKRVRTEEVPIGPDDSSPWVNRGKMN